MGPLHLARLSIAMTVVLGCGRDESGNGGASAKPSDRASNLTSVPSPALDTAPFHTWWAVTAHNAGSVVPDTTSVTPPPGLARTTVQLGGLVLASPDRISRPEAAQGEHWHYREVHQRGDHALQLWIPTDTTGRHSAEGRCRANRTWMGVVPGGDWVAVDLNPYCDTSPGPNPSFISLYWLPGRNWPHVDIETHESRCVSSTLYAFDEQKQRYAPARRVCVP